LLLLGSSAARAAPELTAARAESALAGRTLPDILLHSADGRVVPLSQLWREKPLLLTFYYRRCAGSCTPFLEWVRDAVRTVGGLGRDYRILALTFDDSETSADLRAQAVALRLEGTPDWQFAVASKEEVARLAAGLDYSYRLDPSTGQYDHNSLLVGIEQGRVVRALLGTPQGSARLRELVWELRGSFVPVYQLPGRALLRCLTFDPRSGRMQLDWGLLLLVFPASGAISAALLLFGAGGRRQRVAAGVRASR
jgi:cytochrome oxidase Cu insertion factor (SCO1/SenC/PrrC family)